MYRHITARDYLPRLLEDCRHDLDRYIVHEDGTMHRKGRVIDLLPGPQACQMALKHGVAYQHSGETAFADFTRACLHCAETGLVEWHGHRFWAIEITPSLCNHGRYLRNALYAAQAIGDEEAPRWMTDTMARWPYLPDEHRYVERLLAGPQQPTSVGAFSHSNNMVTEGAVDGWILGRLTGNTELMAQGEDSLLNFILPGQRPDGHWDYQARAEGMRSDESTLPTEYNYSFYLLVILSNLLAYPEWRDRVLEPIARSYAALRAAFEHPDGSIYAPVHWGPGHLFESTLFSAIVSWRLYRATGNEEYRRIAARALHWKEMVKCQGDHVPLCWDRHMLEMMADDFAVEGEVADTTQIIDTLQRFEGKMSLPGASHMQYGRYYGNLSRCFPLQRHIQWLQDDVNGVCPGEITVPRNPATSSPLAINWYRDADILNTQGVLAWNDAALRVRFTVANREHWQPYHGMELFRGDGVLLTLQNDAGETINVNLALTQDGPVIFRYNPALGFGQYREWLTEGKVEGDNLPDASLDVTVEAAQVIYDARLPWNALGITPAAEKTIPCSITITKLRPEGWQYRTWGHSPFDSDNPADPATLRLVNG